MRFLTLSFALLCLFQTINVVGQTPPSVTDTITLDFDTIPLPKRGPNFSNYYGSGQKLFATIPAYEGVKVYESNDFGATWRVKFDKVQDFSATDSAVIYCQYVYGTPISANNWVGNSGFYKIFTSTDNGNTFVVTDSTYVESFRGGRYICEDNYIKHQRLNDSVFIYGINKPCNILNPAGLSYEKPYSIMTKDKGRTWIKNSIETMPNYVVDGTAFNQRDSFLRFTRRADFAYTDSIKLAPIVFFSSYIVGYSFVSGVFTAYQYDNDGSHSGNGIIRSTSNKGLTWQTDTLTFGLPSSSQVVQYKETVFILANDVLYRSEMGNPHRFRRIYPTMPINRAKFSGLSILPSGIYLNGADGALMRSSDGGNTWQIRNITEGVLDGNSALYAFGEDMWLYNQTMPAVYHFEDVNSISRVDTFSRIVPSFGFSSTVFRKDSLYLMGYTNFYRMSRSFDKGFTWEYLPIDNYSFTPKLDSNRIYGMAGEYMYVISEDNTRTFSKYSMPERLWDLVIKKNKIWAVVGNNDNNTKVIRSVDNGATWVTIFTNSDNHLPFQLAMEGETLWLNAVLQSNIWAANVYRSTDDGITWIKMSQIPKLFKSQMTRKKGFLFISASYADGVFDPQSLFVSKNEGITWTRVNNVPNALITDKYIYSSESVLIANNTVTTQFKLRRFPIDSLANKIESGKIYSLLRGQILKDKNANCRGDAADAPFTAKMLRFNGIFNTSTDQNGRFSIMLPVDTYKIEVANERYFALRCGSDTSLKQVIIRPNQPTDTTLFFQKTKTVHDISVALTANGRPRPANELEFIVHLKNLGTETVDSLRLQFDFSNTPVRLVSAAPNAVQNGQKLTWFRRNSLPDAEELLKISVRIDTTAPLSTTLLFYAQADILNQTDTFPSDNRDSSRLIVVGSYDPNDKTVTPDGDIPLSDKLNTFDYIIRFQNTGTDTAYKIVVVDTLPVLLDVHSLIVKSASHNYQLKVDKNVLVFTFDRIMLPDSFVNKRASHGFIRFSISPKKRLQKGEMLNNTAHIFFDYNAAILTNTARNNVYKPTILTQKTVNLCEGDRWQGIVYTRSTIKTDTIQTPLIDTINTTFLDVKPKYYRQIDTIVRLGDSLFGQRLDVNQTVTFICRTVFGCDSITVYNVTVVRPNATTDFDVSKISMLVSPNPVNDWLSINYNLEQAIETELYWVNALGQKRAIIKQKGLDTEGSHSVRLDTRGWAIGLYQLILQTPKGIKRVVFSKI